MKNSMVSLSVMVLVAVSAVSPARAAAEARLVVPESGLVLDGGDLEAAPVAEAAWLDDRCRSPSRRGPGRGEPRRPRRPARSRARPAPRRLRVLGRLLHAPQDPQVGELRDAAALRDAGRARPEALQRQRLRQHSLRAPGASRSVLGSLFGVNTVTGVWNMVEGRKDPNRKTKVKVHGILMLVADAGFAATGFMAPHTRARGVREHERGEPVDPPRDRALVDGRRDRLATSSCSSVTDLWPSRPSSFPRPTPGPPSTATTGWSR